MRFFKLILALLFVTAGYSQHCGDFTSSDLVPINGLQNVNANMGIRNALAAKGSSNGAVVISKQYLSVDFKSASFTSADNNKSTFLRYNILNDRMEYTHGEQFYSLVKSEGDKVYFPTLNTTYKVYKSSKGENLGYYKILTDGKNALLSKKVVKYIAAKQAKTSYGQGTPARFRETTELYFAFDNQAITKVPTGKKQFYAAFGDKSETVKEYAKTNKLKSKNLNDLKKIVAYYNTL